MKIFIILILLFPSIYSHALKVVTIGKAATTPYLDLRCYKGVKNDRFGHPVSASVKFKISKEKKKLSVIRIVNTQINEDFFDPIKMSCSQEVFHSYADLNFNCAGVYSMDEEPIILKIRSSKGEITASWNRRVDSINTINPEQEIKRECKLFPSEK